MSTVVMFKLRVFSFIIFFVLLYLFQKKNQKICYLYFYSSNDLGASSKFRFSKEIMNNCHISPLSQVNENNVGQPQFTNLTRFLLFIYTRTKGWIFYYKNLLSAISQTTTSTTTTKRERTETYVKNCVQHTKYVLM